jgi:hypothetical protein
VLRNEGVSSCKPVFELTRVCRTETLTTAYESPSPSDTDDGGQDVGEAGEAGKTKEDGVTLPSITESPTDESIVKSEPTIKKEHE